MKRMKKLIRKIREKILERTRAVCEPLTARKGKEWRKGVFMVVYRRLLTVDGRLKKYEFLIQKRKLHWKGYEFPKGGIDGKESRIKAVRREVFEETGLSILKLKNHRRSGDYLYETELVDRPGVIGQTWSLYSAEVGEGKVKLDKREHYSSEWLSFASAKKKLTFRNQKECLKAVYDYLKEAA